jgi:alpha-1,2-mannosyltransferase
VSLRSFGGRALADPLLSQIPVIYVDSKAYQKLAIVPLNIIKYNIFPQPGGGPTLYGTESPTFYLRNALLGFNILLPLAFLSLPAIFITAIVDPKRFGDQRDRVPGQTSPALALAIRLVPMHLWFAVLSAQAHKEERFLYPAYGYILLNAATTLYFTRCWLEQAYLKATKSPYRVSLSPSSR